MADRRPADGTVIVAIERATDGASATREFATTPHVGDQVSDRRATLRSDTRHVRRDPRDNSNKAGELRVRIPWRLMDVLGTQQLQISVEVAGLRLRVCPRIAFHQVPRSLRSADAESHAVTRISEN
jgi:hypothetical protein